MRYTVVDLEATCWENDGPFQRENSEIIEIGATRFADYSFDKTFVQDDEQDIQLYIQPVKWPILTEYCTTLTGITQETVNKADRALTVFQDFTDWLDPNYLGSTMVAWGGYDSKMLSKEMKLHGLRFPFNSSINLKECFATYEGSRPKGLKKALTSLGWEFEGRPHCGLDDARNTARIFKYLLHNHQYCIQPSRIS